MVECNRYAVNGWIILIWRVWTAAGVGTVLDVESGTLVDQIRSVYQGGPAFDRAEVALTHLIACLQGRHLLPKVLGGRVGWEGRFECGLVCRSRSSLRSGARKSSHGGEETDGELLHNSVVRMNF